MEEIRHAETDTAAQIEASRLAREASATARESGTRSAHARAARAHRAARDAYPWGHLRKSAHHALAQSHKRAAG